MNKTCLLTNRSVPADCRERRGPSDPAGDRGGEGKREGGFHVERLDAYKVAREVLVASVEVSRGWPPGWSDLRDQLRRAATSSLLNLSEGAGLARGSKAKARHFQIALGSAGEVAAALDAAAALGLSPAPQLEDARRLCNRQGALLGGLLRAVSRQQIASRRSSSSRAGSASARGR